MKKDTKNTFLICSAVSCLSGRMVSFFRCLSKKENQQRQQTYFKIFYNMLFGRDAGPRLYLYLAVADAKDCVKLLQEK